MPTTTANGITIHFTDTGAADKPALVFNHGFFMDKSMFDAQREALEGQYRIVSIDARGHGDTSDEGAPFSYWDLARDTISVMDSLDIDQATLVGMSQGGFTNLRAALIAPTRVSALVMISSEAAATPEGKKAGYRELFGAWETYGPNDGLAQGLAGQLIGDTEFAGPWMEKWVKIPYSQIKMAGENLIERDDLTANLSQIQMPALVTYGALDAGFTDADQEAFAAGLNTWKIVRFDDAGHALNITRAQQFNTLLEEFLSEVRDGVPAAR